MIKNYINGGKIEKVIGVGSSIISVPAKPFTKIIAEKLDLQYEEFSDVGISNEAIFRFISQINLEHKNSLIIVIFTFLHRKELVDNKNNIYSLTTFEKNINDKKNISKYYLKNLYNEQLANIHFWYKLYDIKLSTTHSSNTLFCLWDNLQEYNNNLIMNTIYKKNNLVDATKFKKRVLEDNCFLDFGFGDWCRNNKLGGPDAHGTEEAHKKFASILLKKYYE